MKSDIDIVVESSRRIEQLLAQKFRVKGKGMVEQLNSIKGVKPTRALDYVIRRIAHVRNAVVHRGTTLKDKSGFDKMVEAVIFDLNAISTIEKKAEKKPKKQGFKASVPSKGAAKEKVKPVAKTIQYPPDFDPYVVDLKHGGTFGSDVYKNLRF